MKKICFSIFFFFLMLIPISVSADDMIYGTILVGYHYTEARRMLDIVNNHRISNGRQALVYDYELEELAALRAAEILVYFNHTRPNGQNWSSVFDSDTVHAKYGHWGENICEGWTTAEGAFSAFRNSYKHNENMLNTDYKYVAFACAEVGGSWHWVQLFHSNRSASYPNTYYTSPINGQAYKTVEMTKDKVSLVAVPDHISFDYYENPVLPETYRYYGNVRGRKMNPSWTVDDTSIAGIQNGKLIWRKAGQTNIRATDDLGKTVTVPVYCGAVIISSVTVNMDGKYSYTGSPVEPKPVLTFRGETLKENVDYTIQYGADHTNPGRKSLTVVGMGRFRSTKTLNYEIGKKSQTVTVGISPSTLKVGETAKITSSGVGSVSYKEKSSNAYVYSNGVVGAFYAGTATILVTYSGDKTTEAGSAEVSVVFEAAPTSDKNTARTTKNSSNTKGEYYNNAGSYTNDHVWMRISGKGLKLGRESGNVSLKKGKSVKIKVTSNQKVTFRSSNKKVATVSKKGKVKAKRKGKAVITIRAGNMTYRIKVKVKK